MHPRALNRRLEAEGTTFRKLLNEVRFEVAGQLLLATRMGVTEIAAALGYADTSGFTHAFHHMAGAPPHTWRVFKGDLATPHSAAGMRRTTGGVIRP
jgi:AraC-like DNA-binding protein